MGAKTWMLVYADGDAGEILKSNPPLDRVASAALARELFPGEKLVAIDDGDLSFTSQADDVIYIGCFSGLSIIAAREFGIDHPSKLPGVYLDAACGRDLYLHAMHSAVDWFAYAHWKNGTLLRSLSLSPDSGILEDFGSRSPFEEPYWSGLHPVFNPVSDPEDGEDDYPFCFHPLELGEAALLELFAYQLEGFVDSSQLEPETIPLMGFKRTKPWWRLW